MADKAATDSAAAGGAAAAAAAAAGAKRKADEAGARAAKRRRRRAALKAQQPSAEELRAALAWYQAGGTGELDGLRLELDERPATAAAPEVKAAMSAEQRAELYHAFGLWRACVAVKLHYQAAKCRSCWLLPGYCICGRVPEVRLRSPHRVFFVLNPGEFLRSTNSSKLLVRACPTGARFLLQGVREHEELVRRMVDEEGDRTVLMFPSKDAADLDEHLASLCRRHTPGARLAGGKASKEQVRALPPLNIILVDGTWQQAVAMSKKPWLAGVQHVKLDFKGESLFRDLRKRERDVGGGTVEAAVEMLRALGEDECAEVVMDSLKLLIDVMKVLKQRPPVYGLFTPEEGRAAEVVYLKAKAERKKNPLPGARPPPAAGGDSDAGEAGKKKEAEE